MDYADKYQKFLMDIMNIGEHQGRFEINLGLPEMGYEPFWFDGFYPARAMSNGEFFVYRGGVFMLDIPKDYEIDGEDFYIFYFGMSQFHIDQCPATKMPMRHLSGILHRLKLGF